MNQADKAKPGEYKQSQRVNDLYTQMQNFQATKPAEYQSRFQDQIDNVLGGIMNREDFSYNMEADPLYQQYAKQYVSKGQQAMRDTMGNAAALTGGYGNSYASTAGNQAYQSYLGQLNDKALDLYNIAYQRYQDQGDSMYKQLSALSALDDTQYGRYQDTMSQWNTDRNYLTGLYEGERDFDYRKYQDKWAQYNTDRDYARERYENERDFGYGRYQDALSQYNTDREYEFNEKQAAQSQANWEAEFAYQKEKDAQDRAAAYAAASRSYGRAGDSEDPESPKFNGNAAEGATYAPLSSKTINSYKNEIRHLSPSAAQGRIQYYYESGQISKSQAAELFKYATNPGIVGKQASNPFGRPYK